MIYSLIAAAFISGEPKVSGRKLGLLCLVNSFGEALLARK
jgi:hypothetical protein